MVAPKFSYVSNFIKYTERIFNDKAFFFLTSNKALSQYPTPILNIPEVVAFLHVITEDKSRVHEIKRV